jgi:hypothetical protein
MDKWEAMSEYVAMAMTLETYGEHLFPVTMGDTDYFLAINYLHLSVVNTERVNEQSWTLSEIRVTVSTEGLSWRKRRVRKYRVKGVREYPGVMETAGSGSGRKGVCYSRRTGQE